jgi:hypothetical protein
MLDERTRRCLVVIALVLVLLFGFPARPARGHGPRPGPVREAAGARREAESRAVPRSTRSHHKARFVPRGAARPRRRRSWS